MPIVIDTLTGQPFDTSMWAPEQSAYYDSQGLVGDWWNTISSPVTWNLPGGEGSVTTFPTSWGSDNRGYRPTRGQGQSPPPLADNPPPPPPAPDMPPPPPPPPDIPMAPPPVAGPGGQPAPNPAFGGAPIYVPAARGWTGGDPFGGGGGGGSASSGSGSGSGGGSSGVGSVLGNQPTTIGGGPGGPGGPSIGFSPLMPLNDQWRRRRG
jgi:hypothetical protein